MQFFTVVAVAALAGVTSAAPAVESRQLYQACSGLYGNVQCCATDVLGIANLDCGSPPETFTTAEELQAVCAAIGQRARCCAIPILGQALLCNTPTGVTD